MIRVYCETGFESGWWEGSSQVDDERVTELHKDLPFSLDVLQLPGLEHQLLREHLHGIYPPSLLVLDEPHHSKTAGA